MRLTASMPAWLAAIFAFMTAATPAAAGPALLFEPANGKVLYFEEPDSLWHPASLTKIMTAYLTFEAIKEGKLRLEDKIPCSLVATLQPPSKVGLPVGGELTVEQALQAIIIKSANDVTVMLAEAVAGSETAFVKKMNETARRLGMSRTNFVNTNGRGAGRDIGQRTRRARREPSRTWLPDLWLEGTLQSEND